MQAKPDTEANPTGRQNNIGVTSDVTSDPCEEDWSAEDNSLVASNFSYLMSHNVLEDYQSKDARRATRATEETSDDSDSRAHLAQWLKELLRNLTPSSNVINPRPTMVQSR